MFLIIYFLAAFGFAFIVGFAKISVPFRQWLHDAVRFEKEPGFLNSTEVRRPLWGLQIWLLALLECPACLGFWIGVAVGCAERSLGVIAAFGLSSWPVWLAVLFLALATSASNFIIGALTRLIEV